MILYTILSTRDAISCPVFPVVDPVEEVTVDPVPVTVVDVVVVALLDVLTLLAAAVVTTRAPVFVTSCTGTFEPVLVTVDTVVVEATGVQNCELVL